MSKRRSGGKMTDDEIYTLVATCQEWAGRPFTYPSELAEQLGVTRQAVRYRSESMVEDGRLEKHTPGRVTIYWTAE